MKKNSTWCFLAVCFLLLPNCSKKIVVPVRFNDLNFAGRVNQHKKLIKAKPDCIFARIIDIESFRTLYPSDCIQVSKVTPDPYTVGTVLHTKTKYFVELNWDSRVIELKPNEKIILLFTNGIFKGGYEIWELSKRGDHTEVTHTILYNINGFFPSLVWIFKKGEKKHDYLVERTLTILKEKSEACMEK